MQSRGAVSLDLRRVLLLYVLVSVNIDFQLSLPIIKGYLRAKIGKSIVERRKVRCQLKVSNRKIKNISE